MQTNVSTEIMLRRATADEVVDLRHRVLRAGQERESAVFDGDDLQSTLHFGAFAGEEIVCCLTLLLSDWKGQPAWQLRGMATDERYRGGGIGQTLADYAIREARACRPDVHYFWCNARKSAVAFYRRLGWTVESEPFEVEGIGTHLRMLYQRG